MNWLDKLERKFGKYAIKGLMTYIIGITGLVFVLSLIVKPGIYVSKLMLYPSLVLKGEVWRLFTFIFIPPSFEIIWAIISLYFYYMIGTSLENQWGSFRFNIYYFIGVICTIIGTFITGGPGTATYLNLSLFLAFARLFPDFEVLVFFILPVKMKYLAWLSWAYIGMSILTNPMYMKIAAIVAIFNYFLFFGKDIILRSKGNRRAYKSRQQFKANIPQRDYVHKCTVCGITEKDDPNMEFRYCSRCSGLHEYCMEHLKDHEHIE